MLVRVASTTTDTTDHEDPPRRRRDRWDAHRRSQGVLDGVTVNPTTPSSDSPFAGVTRARGYLVVPLPP